ncbi:MAG: hypothetical protein U1G05_02540 [Kiritimatiellia bacterium]
MIAALATLAAPIAAAALIVRLLRLGSLTERVLAFYCIHHALILTCGYALSALKVLGRVDAWAPAGLVAALGATPGSSSPCAAAAPSKPPPRRGGPIRSPRSRNACSFRFSPRCSSSAPPISPSASSPRRAPTTAWPITSPARRPTRSTGASITSRRTTGRRPRIRAIRPSC